MDNVGPQAVSESTSHCKKHEVNICQSSHLVGMQTDAVNWGVDLEDPLTLEIS